MIKNQCKHEWEKHTDAGRQLDVGIIPATFICKKCHTVMTASEISQLEALENQKKMLIVMAIISILSLIVAIFK